MIERKINVEKLTNKQLEEAEQAISSKINGNIDSLVNKWDALFNQNGLKGKVKVAIKQEGELDNNDFDYLDIALSADDKLLQEMEYDVKEAVNNCNKLLNRYGFVCGMTLVTEQL